MLRNISDRFSRDKTFCFMAWTLPARIQDTCNISSDSVCNLAVKFKSTWINHIRLLIILTFYHFMCERFVRNEMFLPKQCVYAFKMLLVTHLIVWLSAIFVGLSRVPLFLFCSIFSSNMESLQNIIQQANLASLLGLHLVWLSWIKLY